MSTKLKEPNQEIKYWVKKNVEETSELNNFTTEEKRIFRHGLWSMWHKLNSEDTPNTNTTPKPTKQFNQ